MSPSQGSLFGSGAPVEPAEVDRGLVALGAALPRNIRLGTSSWSFPGWAGIVYDRTTTPAVLARHGLAAYGRHPVLRAVGVDRTFYSPLSAEALAEFASAVPASFRFLVKAPAACTSPWIEDAFQRKQPNAFFLDSSWAAAEAVAPYVEGLGPKAGALVFQMVPLGEAHTREPARFAERLASFLLGLPPGPTYAVELRDRKLLGLAYEQVLAATGAVHCLNIHPRMPSIAIQRRLVAEAPPERPFVVRWMLHAGLGYEQAVSRYEPFSRLVDEDLDTRAALADLCIEQSLRGRDVLVVANNKAEGSAPLTQLALARAIRDRLPGRFMAG
jgi:uncharacterized protein YecE (DUF72 family)